jgi:hypothetical protein
LTITITAHVRTHAAITLTLVVGSAAADALQGLRLAEQAEATISYTATCTSPTGWHRTSGGPDLGAGGDRCGRHLHVLLH